jgi:hypothetical protein
LKASSFCLLWCESLWEYSVGVFIFSQFTVKKRCNLHNKWILLKAFSFCLLLCEPLWEYSIRTFILYKSTDKKGVTHIINEFYWNLFLEKKFFFFLFAIKVKDVDDAISKLKNNLDHKIENSDHSILTLAPRLSA